MNINDRKANINLITSLAQILFGEVEFFAEGLGLAFCGELILALRQGLSHCYSIFEGMHRSCQRRSIVGQEF
jgi:hypothetical protein